MNSPVHIDQIGEILLTCPYCHWHGPGDETEPSDRLGDIREIYCPGCLDVIGLVRYPAISMSAEGQCELLQSLSFNHIHSGQVNGRDHI